MGLERVSRKQRLPGVDGGSPSLWAAFLLLLVACEDEQPPAEGGAEVAGGLGGAAGDVTESGSMSGSSAMGSVPVASTEGQGVVEVPTDMPVPIDPAGVLPDAGADADVAVSSPFDPAPACTLGTDVDCAACGDPACSLANTLFACTSANQCARSVCAPGFGSCDSSPDCETSFAAGGTCLPSHRGTTGLATGYLLSSSTAIAPDGSIFHSGAFRETPDFDPGTGEDVHSAGVPGNLAAFITKLEADGSYAWTASFSEVGVGLGLVESTADGGVVAVGIFSTSIDLDPGPGVDQHQGSPGRHILLVKLAADGSFVWGRSMQGVGSAVTDVAVDAADAIYVTGDFQGTVDFDPGPGSAPRTAPSSRTGMLFKLTNAGEFAWVRTLDDGAQCNSSLSSVAVATDGTVWAAGNAIGGLGCEGITVAAVSHPLFLAHTPEGDARGIWWLPAQESAFGTAVAAGANGSVYIGGEAHGLVDLDPGPGAAVRWTGYSAGGFLLKLAPDASLLWGHGLPEMMVTDIAATGDGGVLGVGWGPARGRVVKLGPEGAPGWTFEIGESTEAESVSVRGNSFVVAGANYDPGDFDPGAGIQLLDGNVRFLSRFDF